MKTDVKKFCSWNYDDKLLIVPGLKFLCISPFGMKKWPGYRTELQSELDTAKNAYLVYFVATHTTNMLCVRQWCYGLALSLALVLPLPEELEQVWHINDFRSLTPLFEYIWCYCVPATSVPTFQRAIFLEKGSLSGPILPIRQTHS